MNFFVWGTEREESFTYEGETLRHCDGCLKDINEKEPVIIVPYTYKGEPLKEIWHKSCYENNDVATWY